MLPTAFQFLWVGDTWTLPPGQVYVPPATTEDVGPPASRSRRLVNALVLVCLVALVAYAIGGWGLIGPVFLVWAFILAFRKIRRRA